jgi:MFS family permease
MRGTLQRTFRSLTVRNYRLFFSGQIISVSGTWMQSVAQQWLVLHLTHNGIALGVTAALQFGPMLLIGPWGGVIADRLDKRKVLLATQTAAGLLAAGLAGLTLTGHVTYLAVYGFALCLGLVNAIDNPVRQSFVWEMVGPQLISNAISLNSTTFTSARVIGPAVAGVVIATVGTGWCFAYNAVSYAAVLIALLMMRPEELHKVARPRRESTSLTAGLRHGWRKPELRLVLLLVAAIGLLGFNFNIILPLVATRVFPGGPGTYGLLFSLMGVGALAGALVSANRAYPTVRLLMGAALGFGAFMLLASAMPTLGLEMAVLVAVGVMMVLYQATSNAMLQVNSDPGLRGRVMALYMMLFMGTTPIGGPIVGWIGQALGARAAMATGGLAAIVASALAITWWWRRSTQPGVKASRSAEAEEPVGVA